MHETSDKALIERSVKGDRRAFRTLLDRHYLLIYRLAFRLCGHKEDAQDVTQDVCLKLADALPGFRGEAAFTSWLYPMVLNAARDMQRRAASSRERERRYSEDAALLPQQDSQEAEMMRKQAIDRFRRLPEELRETVLLVAAEGLAHKQAAEVLGVAESTVSWRLMKAKQLLATEEIGHG